MSSPLPASVYFSKAWLHSIPAPSRAAGLHRLTWNLRYARPRAIAYDYAIAAIPGDDTPLTPGGAMVLPGRYQVVLRVDGSTHRAPLVVRQDPRVEVPRSTLIASLALWNRIGQSLARARRGYLEIATARAQLVAIQTALHVGRENVALAKRVSATLEHFNSAEQAPNYEAMNDVLAPIQTSLESSDRAPTQGQQSVALDTIARVNTLWKRWTTVRDRDLARLNSMLRKAGAKPVVIPSADAIRLKEPAGGTEQP